jgi:hypothetical protein
VPAAIAHTSTVTVVEFGVFASTLNEPPGNEPSEALTLTGQWGAVCPPRSFSLLELMNHFNVTNSASNLESLNTFIGVLKTRMQRKAEADFLMPTS